MAIIDVDRMYDEMKNTMECNFEGSANARYEEELEEHKNEEEAEK